MKLTLHKAGCRGHSDHGWLDTWHTFSFANYYNPTRMHFGPLRVLNDDRVQPGMGFGMHAHDNMEIITIVLEGELEHRDNMGNGSVIRSGEVQVMSAGTGIQHSEFNHSATDELSLLQIWLFPQAKNLEPQYNQVSYSDKEIEGKWCSIVSADGHDDSLKINQQAWFSLGKFNKGEEVQLKSHQRGNSWYFFVISGSVSVGEETLQARDGLGVEEAGELLSLKIQADSKILAMELQF